MPDSCTPELIQRYTHPYIKEIDFYTDNCKVIFADGTVRVHPVAVDIPFLSQYGVPISKDGRRFYISSWENGLYCYSAETGETKWHFKSSRITKVCVLGEFLIACRQDKGLYKIDAETGAVLDELRSGTISDFFPLSETLIFVDALRGRRAVLDPAALQPVRVFAKKEFGSDSRMDYYTICGARLDGERVVLSGFWSRPNQASQTVEKARLSFALTDYSYQNQRNHYEKI